MRVLRKMNERPNAEINLVRNGLQYLIITSLSKLSLACYPVTDKCQKKIRLLLVEFNLVLFFQFA
jgi:hypothetical protein